MLGNRLALLVGFFVASAFAVPGGKGRSLIIGDNVYFNDISGNRNRAQALDYCNANGAELAKISGKQLYDILRVTLPAVGSYWIDGIDKQTADRFNANETCTSGAIDFSDIPADNVDLPSSACLSLVKRTSERLSKIQAVPCMTTLRGVVCSFPTKGCQAPTTTLAPTTL